MNHLHEWPTDCMAAKKLQLQLRSQVRILSDTDTVPRPVGSDWLADGLPRLIAGVDASYDSTGADTVCHAAVVVWDRHTQQIVELATATGTQSFPYIPGYLSFREGPIVLAALAKLSAPVGAYLFDGQGLAHPRRFGLACHLGLWLNAPSVGCAKTQLLGVFSPSLAPQAGARVELRDPNLPQPERLGTVLRSQPGGKPLFVSPGHLASHAFAADLVWACIRTHRMPEPTWLADVETKRLRGQTRSREAGDTPS